MVCLWFPCFPTVLLQKQWANRVPSLALITENQSSLHSSAGAVPAPPSANMLPSAAKADQRRLIVLWVKGVQAR